MLACELFEVHSLLRKQGIIFAYSGYVTEAVLSGVGEAIKQKLLFLTHLRRLELKQNLSNHAFHQKHFQIIIALPQVYTLITMEL